MLRRGLIRPPGPIQLAQHRLRGRLLAALDFSSGPAPRDLTGQWPVAIRNGTPGFASGFAGPHATLNGAQSYVLTGSSAGFTGDLSVVAISMRSNTPTTGLLSTTVQTVWTTNPQGGSVGAEMNMGNGFGSAGDITKPRAATNNASTTAAWLDGTKQSGTNPFTSAVANGVWACIGSTHTGASGGGTDLIIGQTSGANNFALTGGVAAIWLFRGILPDGVMADLTASPWQIVETQRRPRRVALYNASSDAAASASGSATASAVGASLADAAGSSAGAATASADGAAPSDGVGSAAGSAVTAAVGASLADAVASTAGSATAAAVSPQFSDAVGSAAGAAIAAAVAYVDTAFLVRGGGIDIRKKRRANVESRRSALEELRASIERRIEEVYDALHGEKPPASVAAVVREAEAVVEHPASRDADVAPLVARMKALEKRLAAAEARLRDDEEDDDLVLILAA